MSSRNRSSYIDFPMAIRVGSRSSGFLTTSSTNHEKRCIHEIFTNPLLVHASLSCNNQIKNCCSATSLRVISSYPCPFLHDDRLLPFRYPSDSNTYNIDQQFLVGSALLVSPNLVSVSHLSPYLNLIRDH